MEFPKFRLWFLLLTFVCAAGIGVHDPRAGNAAPPIPGPAAAPDTRGEPNAVDDPASMGQKIGKQSGVGRIFGQAMRAAGAAAMRIGSIASTLSDGKTFWQSKLTVMTDGRGVPHLVRLFFSMMAIVGAALLAEWLMKRSTEEIRHQLVTAIPSGALQKIGRIFSRLVLNLVGLGIYIVVTFILLFLSYGRDMKSILLISAFVVSSYYFRMFTLAGDTILAPAAPGLRVLPLNDSDAAFFQRWIARIAAVAAFFAAFSSAFQLTADDPLLSLVAYSAAGGSVTLLIAGMIWRGRGRVSQAIRAGAGNGAVSGLRERIARRWHYLAVFYVLAVGLYWFASVLVRGRGELERLMLSIFLIPLFFGADQWGQRLLDRFHPAPEGAAGKTGAVPPEPEAGMDSGVRDTPPSTGMDLGHFIFRMKPALRLLLVAFMVFAMLRLWGIDLPLGRFFTSTALSILVALVLGYLVWEYAKTLIDRKIKEEMPDADEEMEEGGAGGSRKGTLLVLLRKFILTVLFVIVALIILSSIGVEIGPLIAGAGVIGLAIGFGAQTLVKDIISGVFFLIDDAFRVGDYVETAGVKGMVEHISLRSMRLRHPRGMVHTIPFSDMGSVTNYSRDYIISKLDFRVRYDTDVDKVRKVIKKKVYKEILKDPDLGPKLLGKIKSQGVREMDDSAMIMRVKFKTPPGEQFVLRREVFRRMQEAFREAGIQFAHRNVTVYLPGQNEHGDKPDTRAIEAGAAAIAADPADQAADGPKKT